MKTEPDKPFPGSREDRLRSFLIASGQAAGILCLDETDSTNLRLKAWARAGKIKPPFLLTADTQTAGRGRLGRVFVSPPGTGLYMSLFLPPAPETENSGVTILAAVAVCRAIEEETGLHPKIKWVNDLFLRGRKICGILAEGIEEGVILGIGVNLRTPPGGFPLQAGPAGALDAPADPIRLAALITRHVLEGAPHPLAPAILDGYRDRMPLIGRTVRYIQDGQEKSARVTGVKEDGGLMVEADGKEAVLRSGEISLGSQSFLGLE